MQDTLVPPLNFTTSPVHDGYSVTKMANCCEVVGNKQVGKAHLRLQILQEIEYLRLIDTSSALMGSSQTITPAPLRLERSQLLALTSTEFVKTADGGGRETHSIHQLCDPLTTFRSLE